MFFKLVKICGKENVKKNVDLKKLTTIKIGGKAKFVVTPKSIEDIIMLLDYLAKKKVKHYVLGVGSNVLAPTEGYAGVIIKLSNLSNIKQYENYLQVDAGCLLPKLVSYTINQGLKGFEDAIGIPGTVGGAVFMNAGAYNYETKNQVIGVLFLRNGKINYYNASQCEFGYRTSVFGSDDIILCVDFITSAGDITELKNRANAILEKRKGLPKLPNLGSIFKRNEKTIISLMLDEMGLKGTKVNDAMVSHEHAGVIVNTGNATSQDVLELIKILKLKCKQEKNIELMEEIKILQ